MLGELMQHYSLLRMVIIGIVVLSALFSLVQSEQPGVVKAQDGVQSPQALCEAAQATLTEPATREYIEPEQVLETGVDYRVIFCTERGPIYVDLFEDYTPTTVNNFVFLAQEGFYNNTTFYRVIEGFMAQGGDPTATGSGGPGYQFDDEIVPSLTFWREGFLAMANSGPGTNGSQFFITRAATGHLNGLHTIFGHVLEGQDVVNNLTNRVPTAEAESPGDRLHTVLVVTDPSSVASAYQAPELADAERVANTLRGLNFEGYSLVEDATNVHTDTGTALARLEGAASEQVRGLYEQNGFVYEVDARWEIDECPTQPQLLAVGFSLTRWSSEQNAAAVVNDAALLIPSQEAGYTLADAGAEISQIPFEGLFDSPLLFTQPTSDYCGVDATAYRYIWHRDTFTLTLDYIVENGAIPQEDIARVTAFYAYLLELDPAVGIVDIFLPNVVQSG
jgi:cyclophilin family peptidyl-prolyl cis-trans isomerase